MFDDLREFIKKTEEIGEYQLVEGADWDLEIGTITEIMASDPDSPLLLFDKVKGYEAGYRVASNIFLNLKRTALGLGIELPAAARGIDLVKLYRDKIKDGVKPLPPVYVDTGPVKENILTGEDVDLFKFPTPKWHEHDGGRYIGTGSMTITRDIEDGWVNLGAYRIQIHDKFTIAVNIGPGHHGDIMRRKYWANGKSCPAVVICGQEPMLFAAGQFEVPWGDSEYDYAGGLKNKPIVVTKGVTTDLPIPATSEIALEGEILPPEVETRPEGPFGEWPGYYAKGITYQPVMKVKSILHRNNPIIQGCPPFANPATYSVGRHIQVCATLWDELDKQIPGVKGVWNFEEGALKSIIVVSLEQMYGGHAKQAGLLVAGSTRAEISGRFVIVVDDDIDPSNISEVLWALGTRVEPNTAIEVINGCWGYGSNPALPPERRARGDFTHSIAIILACKPYAWIKDFPPSIKSSPELLKKTREKWAWLFSGSKK
ncbi:UbiD family decarboxylase [Chloroflexota bacterium]